jgi:hypothetical protein
MRIRSLAYLAFFLLNIVLLYMQVQLYTSSVETVTSPLLGYYNVPKNLFTIVLISSLLMLPYMIVLVIGALLQADWLYPARLYCAITAMIVLIGRTLFEVTSGDTTLFLLGITDAAFLFLIVEGIVSLLEGLMYG